MAETPSVICFLSDYGTRDEFVGVCKAVLTRLAPGVTVIDVSHEIAAFDVRAGSLTLARAAQYLPPGVILAVVDPTVGTARRAIAVEVETGFLVGPDNGLLAPAVAMLGGASRAVSLTNTDFHIEAAGPTFAGRDIFAPAAASLATGTELFDLGEPIDIHGLMPSILPLTRPVPGGLAAEVLWIDRYGNAQLNVEPDELRQLGLEPGDPLTVTVRQQARSARWVHTYADAGPSELVALVDSYGLVSLALNQASAAEALTVHANTPVTLTV
jgi:S-adenosyl-L-methionine hydrolase (adenosine-forming)